MSHAIPTAYLGAYTRAVKLGLDHAGACQIIGLDPHAYINPTGPLADARSAMAAPQAFQGDRQAEARQVRVLEMQAHGRRAVSGGLAGHDPEAAKAQVALTHYRAGKPLAEACAVAGVAIPADPIARREAPAELVRDYAPPVSADAKANRAAEIASLGRMSVSRHG
jgi:hypothetical protein